MLNAKVTSITGGQATLECENGQTLTAPTSSIEGMVKEGMEVRIVIVAPGAEDAGRQALSRDLLNGLLSA